MTPEDVVATVNLFQVWMGESEPPRLFRVTDVLVHVLQSPGFDVRVGDNVVVSPLLANHLVQALQVLGLELRWADVDPVSGVLDADDLPVDQHTCAIVTHDPPGAVNDYRRLARYGVPVIEDATFALATLYDFEPLTQTGGDVVLFDLPGSVASSEGRACFVFSHLPSISQPTLSSVCNLAEWQLLLNRIGADMDAARQVARYYARHLQGLRLGSRWVQVNPFEPTVTYSVFPIQTNLSDLLVSYLRTHGIGAYPYRQVVQSYWDATSLPAPLPGAEFYLRHTVLLPCGWWVGQEEREFVVETLREWSGTR